MCRRDRPTSSVKQIGILLSVIVVGRPEQIILVVVTAHSHHPSTTHVPHREIGRVDLHRDLRQHVPLLPDSPARRRPHTAPRAPARPDLRGVALQRAGDRVEEIQPGGVDPAPCLDDEGHEVVLVTVLRRFDVAVHRRRAARSLGRAPRKQARRARAHHAHVHQPGGAVQLHLDVGAPLVPRRRHPRPQRGLDAWDALK
jgi:hypothetical protein